jgi:hypothetical protein
MRNKAVEEGTTLSLFTVIRGVINFSTVDYFLNEINFKASRACKIQRARVLLSDMKCLVCVKNSLCPLYSTDQPNRMVNRRVFGTLQHCRLEIRGRPWQANNFAPLAG